MDGWMDGWVKLRTDEVFLCGWEGEVALAEGGGIGGVGGEEVGLGRGECGGGHDMHQWVEIRYGVVLCINGLGENRWRCKGRSVL
jgi:hypothetical protein